MGKKKENRKIKEKKKEKKKQMEFLRGLISNFPLPFFPSRRIIDMNRVLIIR